jgi:hypothetical protein
MAEQFIDQQKFLNWLGGVGRAILGKPSNKFNFNRNFQPVNQKIILLDTSVTALMNVACNVPHLNIVISEGAKMFSNMEITHVDKNGKEIINSEVIKLLNKPNPLQNLEGFLYDYYVNNAIYSSAVCYKNKSALSPIPKVIWWLPTGYIKINLTGKLYRQYKVEEIIESYELIYFNDTFTPDEILHIAEGVGASILKPVSKIEALQIPLSNIVAALKSNNIILTERGLIGFISNEGKDSMGSIPISESERKRIEDQYQSDRGLDSDRSHVMVTTASTKWNPMTFDVAQLKLYEGLEDSFGLICGAWGIDRDVFPSIKGATNENKSAGEKKTYNSTLLPIGKKLCNYLANDFGLTERGEKLICSFNHLPIMQEDEGKMATAQKTRIDSIISMVTSNVINPAQAQELIHRTLGIVVDEKLASSNETAKRLRDFSPLVSNKLIDTLTTNQILDLLGLQGIGPEGDKQREKTTSFNLANQ